MPGYLRQATASQSRAIGPFIDDTDFKTTKTGLTIANTDIKLVVNGGGSSNKNSGGGTHRVNGVYGVTFDATDTATVGEMEVSVVVSGALIVFDKFAVLEEAVYDALFVANAIGYVANQPVDVNTIKTQTVTCSAGVTVSPFVGSTGAAVNGTNANTLSGHDPGATLGTGTSTLTQTQVSGGAYALNSSSFAFNTAHDFTTTQKTSLNSATPVATVGSGGITSSSFAAGAIDATAIAANAIGASELATDAVTEIAAGVWDLATSGHTTSGTFGAAMAAAGAAGDPWSTSLPAAYGAGTAGFYVGTYLNSSIAAVKTDTAAVKTKTDNLPGDPADASDVAALIGALPTAAQNAAGLLDLASGIETGLTMRGAMRLIVAANAGKVSGAETTSVIIRNAVADSKARISATVDSAGNRTVVVTDAT